MLRVLHILRSIMNVLHILQLLPGDLVWGHMFSAFFRVLTPRNSGVLCRRALGLGVWPPPIPVPGCARNPTSLASYPSTCQLRHPEPSPRSLPPFPHCERWQQRDNQATENNENRDVLVLRSELTGPIPGCTTFGIENSGTLRYQTS